MLSNILLVALGGALGSTSRFLFIKVVDLFLMRATSFPLGIMLINIIGSLIMGMLHFLVTDNLENFPLELRLLLMVGFLGGFTTFSSFSLDVLRLITAGHISAALSYIILSVVLSILAIFFGFYLAKAIF